MARLTAAQQRCLASVAAGTVHMHFDVYGGYSWTEGEYRTAGRLTSGDAPRPVLRLMALGLIEFGRVERPYSGCQITPYVLSEAGRAALAKEAQP